jgi:hypothetical protein
MDAGIRVSAIAGEGGGGGGTGIAAAAAATVVLAVMNRVLYKLALVPMRNYPFFLVGINRRLLLGSIVGFCWNRPSALAGIDRRFLLGSTASCKVSSANGNCTRRFGAAERRTFSVFLIAI